MNPTATRLSLDDLNHRYERIHVTKEDAFWAALMGLTDDPVAAQGALSESEIALNRFLQDPANLAMVRAELAANTAMTPDERISWEGWERTFAAHAIESPEARALAEEITELEGQLATARGAMTLGYTLPDGTFTEASSVRLSTLMQTDPDPVMRRAAWEGLRSIEPYVLANGFIEILKKRNQLGRMLGGADYYDAKVRRVEGMTKAEIFALLDELEAATRVSAKASIDALKAKHGADQVDAWNIRFLTSGDVQAAQDPYFPFADSFSRWGRSFAALGISYDGASLVLDLVDRKGKYENGFMHGPEPSWRDRGERRRARIQFTANAIPGLVGSGYRATETLFHEGGHAAHFSNIDMPAPCFGQEFAPTSVAFAETQSMFLDSLMSDADWQARYATSADGAAMPMSLIEEGIRCSQGIAAWQLRAMLTIPYCERALYELPEADLTPEIILATLRAVERKLLFLEEGNSRPALAVPHLLSGDASAYYHGYVLAEMAVEQTRSFFLTRDGHLTDNPKIGPDLKAHYWRAGNSRRFADFIADLTGEPLTARYLADEANRSVEDALAEARVRVAKLASIPTRNAPVDLDAAIAVRHGNEEIASTQGRTFEEASAQFATWISARG